MDYLAIILTIFMMGLQAYFARGGQGGTLEARRQRYERAPQQPLLAAAGSDVFVTLRESTHLSHSLFQRLAVVEQMQDEQAVKMAGQERQIMLLKQQNQELQDISRDQDTVIKIQSSKIERHERQITKLRSLLKELGKEITDEELEKMANETAT